MLEVRSLSTWYGKAQILFDVALDVAPGEVVALMGRNGAGKSTTMKAIMGLIEQRQGSIQFREQEIIHAEPHQIARLGLGYVPEDRRIFSDLTVRENLAVGQQRARAGTYTWTEQAMFELFPNLAEMPHRPGGQMSGGEQQMLTVARTLMGNPYLVLLDEPSEGVAPLIVQQMAKTILALKKQGLSVLLSEQNFKFAQQVSDRAVVLEKGQVRFMGTMGELQSNPGLQEQLLGLSGG
jgi:branched-chain amino acid transport system ATP-binding protein